MIMRRIRIVGGHRGSSVDLFGNSVIRVPLTAAERTSRVRLKATTPCPRYQGVFQPNKNVHENKMLEAEAARCSSPCLAGHFHSHVSACVAMGSNIVGLRLRPSSRG